MKSIVTISRQFGSGGHTIGKLAAERLGFPFYDQEIIERVMERTGLSENIFRRQVNMPQRIVVLCSISPLLLP